MEGGTYADEAEARGRAIIALDVLRRTETHANADGGDVSASGFGCC